MTPLPDDADDPQQPDQRYHREVYDDWGEEVAPGPELHSRGLDFGLLLLRLGLLLLLAHGVAKAVDMPAFVRQVDGNVVGGQAPELLAWLVMGGQVALPVLVAVGLFTRPAAFLLAASTAAIWILEIFLRTGYRPLADDGSLTGEAALLYVALSLPLAFTGAGRWSLDFLRTGGQP
jgi:putative oxidoreductase